MKHILTFIVLFVAVAFTACSNKSSIDAIAEKASLTAKQYYEYLLEGKYAQFVDGQYRVDSIPQVYRAQLIENAKMFIGQQKDEHKGIKDISVQDVKVDTAKHSANVFLIFSYGDNTKEEVVVPMVEHADNWYLR